MADDASAPGAAGHEEGSAPLSASKVSFLLVPLIRTEQGQNGVKHGDYARYRCVPCCAIDARARLGAQADTSSRRVICVRRPQAPQL